MQFKDKLIAIKEQFFREFHSAAFKERLRIQDGHSLHRDNHRLILFHFTSLCIQVASFSPTVSNALDTWPSKQINSLCKYPSDHQLCFPFDPTAFLSSQIDCHYHARKRTFVFFLWEGNANNLLTKNASAVIWIEIKAADGGREGRASSLHQFNVLQTDELNDSWQKSSQF